MVAHVLPKHRVAGSNPVSRSTESWIGTASICRPVFMPETPTSSCFYLVNQLLPSEHSRPMPHSAEIVVFAAPSIMPADGVIVSVFAPPRYARPHTPDPPPWPQRAA